jgi:hypothetical protein
VTSKKSFAISKRMVFEAWKRVKANRGAAGIDAESIAKFEANLVNNLYVLWTASRRVATFHRQSWKYRYRNGTEGSVY